MFVFALCVKICPISRAKTIFLFKLFEQMLKKAVKCGRQEVSRAACVLCFELFELFGESVKLFFFSLFF